MTIKHLRPHPGPQTDFLSSRADVALFGGGAGAGGTTALFLDWARHITRPCATGLFLRARPSDVTAGAWPAARKFFAGSAGMRAGAFMDMTWPSGSRLLFGNDGPDLLDRMRGVQLSWIGVDHAQDCDVDRILELLLRRGRAVGATKPGLRMSAVADPTSPLAMWVADGFISGRPSISFEFFHATIADNPSLASTDYPERLSMCGKEERARLLHGRWEARA